MNARAKRQVAASKDANGRERILEAACALFQERGYPGLSISSICERANIAPTSIYWHFGDKAGLLRAIVERTSGHAPQIRKAVLRAAGDREAQLDILIRKIRELVVEQPLGSLSFVALLSGGGAVTDELRAALVDVRRNELDSMTEDFAAMFGPKTGRAAALMVLAFVNYAALTYRVTRRGRDVDEILEAMREQLLMQHRGASSSGGRALAGTPR
jgi:AcrR family transcriptional regulator